MCPQSLSKYLTQILGISSTRTSSCYAYIVCVLGHKLPIPRRPALDLTNVLPSDIQAAEAVGP